MVAGRRTLLEQPAAAELLPACAARGVRVVAVGVFNPGALAQDVPARTSRTSTAPCTRRPRTPLPARRGAPRHGTTLPTAALRLPLRHPAVAGIVFDADSPDQVRQNADRLTEVLPEELWSEVASLGAELTAPQQR